MNPNRSLLYTSDSLMERIEQASLLDGVVDEDLRDWLDWFARESRVPAPPVPSSTTIAHGWLENIQQVLMGDHREEAADEICKIHPTYQGIRAPKSKHPECTCFLVYEWRNAK